MSDCTAVCNKGISMMQGDSWPLEIKITLGGEPLNTSTVEIVEISIDELTKTWPNGGVSYKPDKGVFTIWPTQEESFKMRGRKRVQARVKLKDSGSVIGLDFGTVDIKESLSKEVL